ncbi:MAG TPA: hypothetical protein VIP11_06815 [Gemmatimonadaceae bacterium]
MNRRTPRLSAHALIVVAMLGCADSTSPGCLCRPMTGLGFDGQVTQGPGYGARSVPSTIRLTVTDPLSSTNSKIGDCVGEVERDTTVASDRSGHFRASAFVGFPVFEVCVNMQITPNDTSIRGRTVSYAGLVLRDTSFHDTLRVVINLP